MLSLYLIGFLAALVTARLLKSSILKANAAPSFWNCHSTGGPPAHIGLRLWIAARSS